MNEKAESKLGYILVNAKGLRKIADSLEFIYSSNKVIKLPVWRDAQEPLYFQLDKGTGEINCVVHDEDRR